MAATFANQGWGQLCEIQSVLLCVEADQEPAATLFSFIIIAAYKQSFLNGTPDTALRSLDQIWRLVIGLGCVPAAIAIYFRLTIPETPRFTIDIERNIRQATSDVDALLSRNEVYTVDPDALTQRVQARQATRGDFQSYFSKWQNLKVLIGTAYSWFALDVRTHFLLYRVDQP